MRDKNAESRTITANDRETEKDRLTREGLASIDAGRVVAHEDVKAWAASLDSKKPLRRPRVK